MLPSAPMFVRSQQELTLTFKININGSSHSVDVDGDTPLLWVLRDVLGMTGTKFGCGIAQCGACTVQKIQRAWLEREVVQCGYCQSGQIMSASALLAANPHPTDADIDDAMAGNICRCGTYSRIRQAIKEAAQSSGRGG